MDNPSFAWISSLQSPFQVAFLVALHLGGEVSGWEWGQNLGQRWCWRNFLDESLRLGRAQAGEVAEFVFLERSVKLLHSGTYVSIYLSIYLNTM